MDDLVTTEWLARNLGAPDLTIVDSSLFMPSDARDPSDEFPASAYSRRKVPRPLRWLPTVEHGAPLMPSAEQIWSGK